MFNLTAVFLKRFKIKKVKLYDYYVGIHASLLMLVNTSDPYSTCSLASIHCSPTPPLYTQTHYLHKQFIQCKNNFVTIKVVRYPKNLQRKLLQETLLHAYDIFPTAMIERTVFLLFPFKMYFSNKANNPSSPPETSQGVQTTTQLFKVKVIADNIYHKNGML